MTSASTRYGTTRAGTSYRTETTAKAKSGFTVRNVVGWAQNLHDETRQGYSSNKKAILERTPVFQEMRTIIPSIYADVMDIQQRTPKLVDNSEMQIGKRLNESLTAILDPIGLDNPYIGRNRTVGKMIKRSAHHDDFFQQFKLDVIGQNNLSNDFSFPRGTYPKIAQIIKRNMHAEKSLTDQISISGAESWKQNMGQYPTKVTDGLVEWHIVMTFPLTDASDLEHVNTKVKRTMAKVSEKGKQENRTFKIVSYTMNVYARPYSATEIFKPSSLFSISSSWVSPQFTDQRRAGNWIDNITSFYRQHGGSISRDEFNELFKHDVAYDPRTYASLKNMFEMMDKMYRGNDSDNSYVLSLDMLCRVVRTV